MSESVKGGTLERSFGEPHEGEIPSNSHSLLAFYYWIGEDSANHMASGVGKAPAE